MADDVKPVHLTSYFVAAAVVWTATLLASLAWNVAQTKAAAIALALNDARGTVSKDLVYRRWAAGHGGVYVPITPVTPPNPLLANVPDRDIETTTGRKLTLVNPAYMTRQVHELDEAFGRRSRITSLRPLRRENAPDAWEEHALRLVEAEHGEVHEIVEVRGEPHLRYLLELTTEPRCLACHGAQGYREGDTRGGLAVVLPLAAPLAIAARQQRHLALCHLAIWGIGLAALFYGASRARAAEARRGAAAAAIRSAQDRLAIALRAGGVGLWELDVAADRVTWDAVAPYERAPGDLPDVGSVGALVHPDDLARVTEAAGAFRTAAAERLDVEHRFRAPDGSWRWAHVRGTAVSRDAAGRVLRVAGTLVDVTERRAADVHRERLETQLQHSRRLEAVGRLAGGVAHDLNNLLTPILSCSELAAEALEPGHPAREDLGEVRAAADRARDLVRRLLAFGRAQRLEVTSLDPAAVVRDLLPMLRRIIGEDVAIEVAFAEDLPQVSGDAAQLELALMNLAANARDAMPGGGVLRFSVAPERLDGAAAAALEVAPGTYVALAASDTGVGMSAETLAHLFEPFYTTKPVGKGTGLGLASVHGLVRQLGGAVAVESALGRGTTVRLLLPPASGPAATPSRSEEREAPRGVERVLLAEDDPAVRRTLAGTLASLGYEVLVADGPDEALRLARAARVDLLVSDVVMPGLSGPKLHEWLTTEHPGLPVLFVSGYARVAAGADLPRGATVVQKPCSRAELGVAVRRVLDAADAPDAAGAG